MAQRATDIEIELHGSLVLVRPLTRVARAWLSEVTPDEAQWWGALDAAALVVEPRYLEALLKGAADEGFSWRRA